MTEGNPRTSPAKLSVGLAVEHSLKSLFGDLPALLKLSWPWLLIVGGLTYYMTRYFMPSIMDPALSAWFGGMTMLQQFITFVAGAVMAVGWHRKVLLGVQPTAASALPGAYAFRYLGAAILMGIALILPFILFGVVFAMLLPTGAGAVANPGALGAGLVAFVILGGLLMFMAALRLSLVLPARAVGDNALRFRDAWTASRGNTLRMFFGVFLTFIVPIMVIQLVFFPLFGAGLPEPGNKTDMKAAFEALALPTALMTMITMMISMMGISFISYAYRHFFSERLAQAKAM